MAAPQTVGDLVKARVVTQKDMEEALDAFLADPGVGVFEIARGCLVDITAAVKASRHTTATLTEPTAKTGSRRAAVKTAILLAHPVKG